MGEPEEPADRSKVTGADPAAPRLLPLPGPLLWIGVVVSAILFALSIWLSAHADETVPRDANTPAVTPRR